MELGDMLSFPSDEEVSPLHEALDRLERAEKVHNNFVKISLDPKESARLKAGLLKRGTIRSPSEFESVIKRSMASAKKNVSDARLAFEKEAGRRIKLVERVGAPRPAGRVRLVNRLKPGVAKTRRSKKH